MEWSGQLPRSNHWWWTRLLMPVLVRAQMQLGHTQAKPEESRYKGAIDIQYAVDKADLVLLPLLSSTRLVPTHPIQTRPTYNKTISNKSSRHNAHTHSTYTLIPSLAFLSICLNLHAPRPTTSTILDNATLAHSLRSFASTENHSL